LELNRRLVAKSRHSEVFSAVNASVGPPHFFVISSNLTTINTRTIGSVLTLHRHFHLSLGDRLRPDVLRRPDPPGRTDRTAASGGRTPLGAQEADDDRAGAVRSDLREN